MQLKENVTVVYSATGWEQTGGAAGTDKAESAADRQHRAGEAQGQLNTREITSEEVLRDLSRGWRVGGKGKIWDCPSCLFVECPHCGDNWFMQDPPQRQSVVRHTCALIRHGYIAQVFADIHLRLAEKAQVAAAGDAEGEGAALSVTRVTASPEFHWVEGSGVQEEAEWKTVAVTTPPKKKPRQSSDDRSIPKNAAVYERVLDNYGRVRFFALRTTILQYPHQLLAHKYGAHLRTGGLGSQNDTPLPFSNVYFIKLSDFVAQADHQALGKAGVAPDKLAQADSSCWLASYHDPVNPDNSSEPDWLFKQAVAALQGKALKVFEPAHSLAELEQAAVTRLAMGKLKPYGVDYTTLTDVYAKTRYFGEDVSVEVSDEAGASIGQISAQTETSSGNDGTHDGDLEQEEVDDTAGLDFLPENTDGKCASLRPIIRFGLI